MCVLICLFMPRCFLCLGAQTATAAQGSIKCKYKSFHRLLVTFSWIFNWWICKIILRSRVMAIVLLTLKAIADSSDSSLDPRPSFHFYIGRANNYSRPVQQHLHVSPQIYTTNFVNSPYNYGNNERHCFGLCDCLLSSTLCGQCLYQDIHHFCTRMK